MAVVVAGTFRIPPENLEALKTHAGLLIAATRGEDGCLVYSFAVDLEDAGLIRVFEHWRDQAALDAHFATPHMKAWLAVRGGFGVYGRMISVYEVGHLRVRGVCAWRPPSAKPRAGWHNGAAEDCLFAERPMRPRLTDARTDFCFPKGLRAVDRRADIRVANG